VASTSKTPEKNNNTPVNTEFITVHTGNQDLT